MGLACSRQRLFFDEIEDLAERLSHSCHEGVRKAGHRALSEAPIVDGPELVDQDVGVAAQTTGSSDSDAERLGVIHQVGGKWDDQRRRVICIEKRLGLDDEDWPGLARFGAASSPQIR